MKHKLSIYVVALIVAAFSLAIAGCGDDDDGGGGGGEQRSPGNLSISGVWTGQEARSFNAVLDGFKGEKPRRRPSSTARSATRSRPCCRRPSRAATRPTSRRSRSPASRGTSSSQGALKPLDFAKSTIEDNFTEGAVEAGTVDDKLYGLLFKAANKSTVWYNVPLYEQAGVSRPRTSTPSSRTPKTLKLIGHARYSIGAADGWTLTDLFENIYLRQAGPEKYDQLAEHEIPWTDQSVKDALDDDGADRRRAVQHRRAAVGRARDGLPDAR